MGIGLNLFIREILDQLFGGEESFQEFKREEFEICTKNLCQKQCLEKHNLCPESPRGVGFGTCPENLHADSREGEGFGIGPNNQCTNNPFSEAQRRGS